MMRFSLRRFLLSPSEIHLLCAAVAIICCVAILFPEVCPYGATETLQHYAGWGLTLSFLISLVFMLLAGFIHMMRLNNTHALFQLLRWGGVWCAGSLFFIFVALLADMDAPEEANGVVAIQTTDTLYPPHEPLNGPASLQIPIVPEKEEANTVAEMPYLTQLEQEHSDVLKTYLEISPRWSGKEDNDAFYSHPGHLVMTPPVSSGVPGLVHVCFRRLTEGAPLPKGYTVVKPGSDFPEDSEATTDLAVDLGRNHYLLLAWRGTAHTETVRCALNAAIRAVDARMQVLAESPTIDTIHRMLAGRSSYPGHEPELRLSEPVSQEGTYQAEIYANPHEAGTLLLYIKDIDSGKTLRLFTCPAQYSGQKEELFRHDIPGSVPEWARSIRSELYGLFPPRTPLFVICTGKSHHYFGAAFEVWFRPFDNKPPRLILRRCYKVQPYEIPEIAVRETLQREVNEDTPSDSGEEAKTHPDKVTPEQTFPEQEETTPDTSALPNIPDDTMEPPDASEAPADL